MERKNQLHMIFDACEENVAIARLTAAAFASCLDFTLSQIDEVKVAVSEAVSNAVIHAYPKGQGKVELTMEEYDSCVVYEIRDWGIGIADIEKARRAEFSTRAERMGLGFAFMESFMDTVAVESVVGQGTSVRMVKSCSTLAVQ